MRWLALPNSRRAPSTSTPRITPLSLWNAASAGYDAIAALLQVELPATMAALPADPEMRPYLRAAPGAPALALVRLDAIDRLRTLLTGRGTSLSDSLLR